MQIRVRPLYDWERRQRGAQAGCWRGFTEAYPMLEAEFVGLCTPFSDELLRECFFDGGLMMLSKACSAKCLLAWTLPCMQQRSAAWR